MLGKRAGVDADPQWHAGRCRSGNNLSDLFRAADVAGVKTDARGTIGDRLQRQRVVEVDVSDYRDRRLGDKSFQRFGIAFTRRF